MKHLSYDGSEEYLLLKQEEVKQTVAEIESRGLDKHSFCVMPFVTIILEPDGQVGICRHKGTKFPFGNLREQSIKEIWETERLQAWRTELITKNPGICKTELIDRKCNLCPEMNKLLPYAEITNTKNPKILRLTANLNGKCNLQCQMCDVWQMPNGYYTEENFWKPAREMFFKEILEADLLSGEPFIQKDTYRLIDEISEVNPACSWTFTTNMHWVLNKKIEDSLNKIKIKNIIISIDSFEEATFAKIRKLGNLNFALKNIDALLEYEKRRINLNLTPLTIRLNFLLQKDNRFELKNVFSYCKSKGIIPFATFLYEPVQFSMLTAPECERIEVLEYYFRELSKEEILLSMRVIRPILKSLEKINYRSMMLALDEILNR